jgi:AraC-like DNA-binding protein
MLKMREAAKLLKRGHSVHEVSAMLSFATQNYFSASFKREFGISPSEYIKENKQ